MTKGELDFVGQALLPVRFFWRLLPEDSQEWLSYQKAMDRQAFSARRSQISSLFWEGNSNAVRYREKFN
jgi:hypothetical protein